jgi:hypothetical protein
MVNSTILCLALELLTNWIQQRPAWEANRFSPCQQIPSFYGTRKFITAFTISPHLSLSCAISMLSMLSYLYSCRLLILLFSHLHLGFPRVSFPSGFPTKTLYTPLYLLIRATCPSLLILDFISGIVYGEEYCLLSCSLCSFLYYLLPRPS